MRPLLLCALLLTACVAGDATAPRVRPATWAQPVIGAGPGNWFQVSDELYRCEQPSSKEMKVLETFGMKAVVNLREFHSDKDEAEKTALTVSEIKLDAGELPYTQLVAALKLVLSAPKPVVVHCWHGSDRTGAVVAGYRVAVQGWTPAAALDEMVNGGYGHHQMYDNLRALIGGLDAAKLRADLRR